MALELCSAQPECPPRKSSGQCRRAEKYALAQSPQGPWLKSAFTVTSAHTRPTEFQILASRCQQGLDSVDAMEGKVGHGVQRMRRVTQQEQVPCPRAHALEKSGTGDRGQGRVTQQEQVPGLSSQNSSHGHTGDQDMHARRAKGPSGGKAPPGSGPVDKLLPATAEPPLATGSQQAPSWADTHTAQCSRAPARGQAGGVGWWPLSPPHCSVPEACADISVT